MLAESTLTELLIWQKFGNSKAMCTNICTHCGVHSCLLGNCTCWFHTTVFCGPSTPTSLLPAVAEMCDFSLGQCCFVSRHGPFHISLSHRVICASPALINTAGCVVLRGVMHCQLQNQGERVNQSKTRISRLQTACETFLQKKMINKLSQLFL